MNPPPLSARETGKALGLAHATVLKLYRAGAIPAVIAEGRILRFDLAAVREALEARAALAQAQAAIRTPLLMVPTL